MKSIFVELVEESPRGTASHELQHSGHEIEPYRRELLAYYRFNSIDKDTTFIRDQYRDSYHAYIICNSGDCHGVDLKPNDICLRSTTMENFLTFK
jgi:hypothetical protein